MLKRWLPKERLGRQALVGLLIWAVCGVVAAGLGTLGDEHFRWHDREGNSVQQAVLQHGATSPEAAAAVAAMGAKAGAGTVIALIDPATGTAVAAFPQELVGKKPEEITVNDARLPQLSYLQQQQQTRREGERRDGNKLMLEVSPIGFDARESGRQHDRMGKDGHYNAKGHGRMGTPTAAAAQPTPLLVVAAPAHTVSATEIAARAVAGVAALGFVLYWLSVAWWAFKDAQARRKPAYIWGIVVLLTNLVGLVVYFLVRNVEHTCPACGAQAGRSFTFCPECGTALKESCPKCGKKLKAGWNYCAACGTPREPDKTEA